MDILQLGNSNKRNAFILTMSTYAGRKDDGSYGANLSSRLSVKKNFNTDFKGRRIYKNETGFLIVGVNSDPMIYFDYNQRGMDLQFLWFTVSLFSIGANIVESD